MRKAVLAIILFLCSAMLLQGQVVDTTIWRQQGNGALLFGESSLLVGGATAAVGGGLILLAYSPSMNPEVPEGELNENMLPGLLYVFGLCSAIVGVSAIVVGIQATVAGNAIIKHNLPRTDARYDNGGLGVILEGGYLLPTVLQARTSVGYHFNHKYFLGCGIAPGYMLNSDEYMLDGSPWSVPLYADFRWSLSKSLFAPYLGFSAGVELADFSPYLAAEIGGRIRTSLQSPRSMWTSLCGEVSGPYMRLGFKMGYSF